ncbi:MAG: hypothetical protein LC637_08400 [Xanthomonadaceae bacterium]|nr:hypothetical protein [Xanthomonadaceae bacterium]
MSAWRARLAASWRAAFVVLVGGWLAWVLLSGEFGPAPRPGTWLQVQTGLFLAGWLALPLGLGLLWRWNLQLLTAIRLPLALLLTTQGLAWGGRYLPGKSGLWLAKLSISRRSGIDLRTLGWAVLVEQGLFVLAGALVFIVLLPWSDIAARVAWQHPALSALQALAAHPLFGPARILFAIALAAVGLAAMRIGKAALPEGARWPDWSQWLLLLAGHLVLHLTIGLALAPLLWLLLPDSAALLGTSGIIAALALANIAGILALFAPAGLGVREVVLAGLLAAGADYPKALAVAAFLRLVTFLADVAFSTSAWAAGMLIGRGLESRASD